MVRKFKDLSVYLECASGSTPRVETVKNYIDIMQKLGYTKLYLGLSGAYHIDDEPYFAYKKGKYTTKQLQAIDSFGKEKGIEIIAGIQTLAHLSFMSMHDHFAQLTYGTTEIKLLSSQINVKEKGWSKIHPFHHI